MYIPTSGWQSDPTLTTSKQQSSRGLRSTTRKLSQSSKNISTKLLRYFSKLISQENKNSKLPKRHGHLNNWTYYNLLACIPGSFVCPPFCRWFSNTCSIFFLLEEISTQSVKDLYTICHFMYRWMRTGLRTTLCPTYWRHSRGSSSQEADPVSSNNQVGKKLFFYILNAECMISFVSVLNKQKLEHL